MANNQLIQGAALTGKKFLDVGAAVSQGLDGSNEGNGGNTVNSREAKNQAIQEQVNRYMGKMKTDMDFTSFSPAETKTMRSFLSDQRSKYATAAKAAAAHTDTTDPDYMAQVDIMQGVNNSFTNLAKQLGSYKKGKAEYAQGQIEGIYSDGTDPEVGTDTAIMYGFWDNDGDKKMSKEEGGYDSPFQIQEGGNLGFNINGKEVIYNETSEPILKDFKLAGEILDQNESVFKSGKRMDADDPSLVSYRMQLSQKLQNQDSLTSIIFDYEDEFPGMKESIQDKITDGSMGYTEARKKVVDLLVNARINVAQEGYDQVENERIRKLEIQQGTLTPGQYFNQKKQRTVVLTANNDLEKPFSEGVNVHEL
jgi:hypothetical protein